MASSRTRSQPRTYADDLRARDDAQLAALVRERPDLSRPTPADMTQVASRASTRVSVSQVVDRLDAHHLGVLTALAVLEEPTALASVRAVVHAPARAVTSAVRRLRELGLVWGPDSALRAVRAVGELLGPYPAGLGPTLEQALRAYPASRAAQLRSDLAVAGVDVAAEGDPVAAVAAAMTPGVVGDLVTAASTAAPEAEHVLSRLAWGPPTGRLGTAQVDVGMADARTPIDQLVSRGLLVVLDERTVVLPREVALQLRGGHLTRERTDQPPRIRSEPRDEGPVDRTAAGAAFEAIRQVELVLEAWSSAPPSVLRSGGLGVRDLRAAAGMAETDEERIAFLLDIAYSAGLIGAGEPVQSRDGAESWLPTAAFDTWLSGAAADRWWTLASAWLSTTRATALLGTRDERDRAVTPMDPDLVRAQAPAFRWLALRALASLPAPAAPLDPTDVVEHAAWHRPRRGALRDDVVRATLIEAERLGLTALGALATHGRAALDGGGASVAALAPLLPDPVDHVLLQADLTAVAPGPLETHLAATMGLLAEVESRGGATVFRFTTESVRRALDVGWPVEQVHAFLAAHSRTPVPQPLSYLVDDVARRHGRLRIGNASVYLRSDDPAELDALLADRAMSSLRLRRLGPTVAVTDVPAEMTLARLRAEGRGPVAEDLDGTPRALRPDSLRAPARSVPASSPVTLTPEEADTVVAAVRAGDNAARSRPPDADAARLRRTASMDVVAALRAAAEARNSVWLAYMDQAGALTERVVDPMRVEAGWLTAYDHRSNHTQSFAVHRISKVAAAKRP
ncbi:MAG: helicase-associated domain-containing protein [Nocardioidaceae bacterium]